MRATEKELKVSSLKQGKNELLAQLEHFFQARNRSHQIGRISDEYRAAVRARNREQARADQRARARSCDELVRDKCATSSRKTVSSNISLN